MLSKHFITVPQLVLVVDLQDLVYIFVFVNNHYVKLHEEELFVLFL